MAQPLPQEGLTLEGLVKYRNSLTELWETEDFQPVKWYLAGLYKEAIEALVYKHFTEQKDLVAIAEHSAVAKLANSLFNLPDVLKQVEGAFVQQQDMRAKMAAEAAPLPFEVTGKGRKQ